MNLKRLTLTSAVSALAMSFGFATGAHALQAKSFDEDGDRYVTFEEFSTGTQQTWMAHDEDRDDRWSREEFERRFAADGDVDAFAQFDADQDDYLTRDEFNAGLFASYDQDADERWGEDEWSSYDQEMSGYDSETAMSDEKLNIRVN